ncbi:hypothetical protein K469DRAFT_680758 [Zopfia rhizophila CBS 207.26]|uniref:Uncharacterized protein n=1 Tax=Zopfia rhizophila CBS 207.26 TaxID=1314779 RepID=A0A6A6D759_9PEZI|nr:hypothetical protein K469DRAFT_680758 [Zopfia rhizophila CBS 207.26]
MRYENWDIILFPRDSHVPIQEFKTACYAAQDEYGRQFSTLTCYIASLPTSTPFRISVHSWMKPKPTTLIGSQRMAHQKVVYNIRVVVDGTRVFHEYYEVAGKWPQEIEYEKRLPGYPDHQTSQRKPPLQFPPFHQNVLMQSSWDVRESSGRIKLFLSEQLLNNTNSTRDLEIGATNDIVCFSFQHAPRDVLEQAGLSWPLRNPLYLSSALAARQSRSQTPTSYAKPRNRVPDSRAQSPVSKQSGNIFARPHNPELHTKLKSEPFPKFSQFPVPPGREQPRRRAGIWDDSLSESLGDPFDDISMMDTWSTRHTSSNSTADISMPDYFLASPVPPRPKQHRENRISNDEAPKEAGGENRRKKEEKQVVMTLRDDQFGALIEALSPPKKGRNYEQDYTHDRERTHPIQATSQAYAPRAGPTSIPIVTRPSAAALARTASYPEFSGHLRDISNKAASPQENQKPGSNEAYKSPLLRHHSFASGKENRAPTPHLFEKRVPTPYPSAHLPAPGPFYHRLSPWESDVSMKGPSSVLSSLSRLEKGEAWSVKEKSSPAPAPVSAGSIKSRKEGLGVGPPASTDLGIRHDKSLLPGLDTMVPLEQPKVPQNTPVMTSPNTIVRHTSPNIRIENALNAEELKLHTSSHGGGVGSLGRIEKQLWNALGDELSSFSMQAGTVDQSNSNSTVFESKALTGLGEVDGSVTKRKRQGTMGGERGRSPDAKVLREEGVDVGKGIGGSTE